MTDLVGARGRRPAVTPRRGAARATAALSVALLSGCLLSGCAQSAPGLVPGPGGDPAVGGPAVPAPGAIASGGIGPAAYAAALVDGTNRVRAAEGLPALMAAACAAEAATARARALVGTTGLEHAPLDDVLAACEPRSRAAENLSRAAAPPDDVVDAWMASPGHRENLLSEQLTELGVGCVPDGDAMVCSQVFLGP